MKIKLDTHKLSIGMYVSELDRPWIETPFLFQGFLLNTPEDIEQVQAICSYVYVDAEKTPPSVRPHLLRLQRAETAARKSKPVDFSSTSTFHVSDNEQFEQTAFQQRVQMAKKIRDETRSYVDRVFDDIRMGRSVDSQRAKSLVSKVVDNIVSSADASLWLTQLKRRDEYTAIHSVNVCILSITFGRALGMSKDQLNVLGLGALLHDIGKMKVPLEVLNKPGKLTDDEFITMQGHPQQGYEMLQHDSGICAEALEVVQSHHERLGGRGYPKGLREHQITQYTRIVSIVDVYDAITSDRCYHDGMTPHEALKNMYNWIPGNFDKQLMEIFIRTIGIYPVGSVVEFHSGHVGVVVKVNPDAKLKPVVMLLLNREKQAYPRRKLINLASPQWKGRSVDITRIIDPKEYDINVSAILSEECAR